MSTLDNIHEARLLRERVRYSLTFLNLNLVMIPVGAFLCCLATWEFIGGWRAVLWTSLLTLLSALSFILFRNVEVQEMELKRVGRLEHLLGCNSVSFGLCYGLGAFSLYGASPVSDMLILITVNILIVGVTTSYFAQTHYAKLNIFVIMTPTIFYFAGQSQILYRVLLFLSVLYLLRGLGLVTRYSGYFHDLNHLSYALEKEKNEAERNYQDLQRSEALRHKLTQMVVHDLRTPLTSIVGHLHLIKKKSVRGEPETAIKNLEKAQSLSADLVAMVGNILEVSRAEDKQMPLLQERVGWGDILDVALEDLGKGKQRVRVVGEQSLEGYWDAQLLRRVLVNLLSNALRFSPPNEMVLLGVKSETEQLLVTIRDKGPGVPPGMEEKVFDQYFSVDSENSNTQSFGIGLYFCRMAIEKHNGQIGVRQGEDVGAEFWFRLPIHSESAL